MGFREWMKERKKKHQQERMEKRRQEELAERSFNLAGNNSGLTVDPADINPPETRFTDEYREFLEKQEAAAAAKAERLAQERLNEELEADIAAKAEDN
ncbi:MAG: hypothetical protein IKZ82_07345 [Clostridia bacterium]|nr:hypothetical protein [Clostridia bacterium]